MFFIAKRCSSSPSDVLHRQAMFFIASVLCERGNLLLDHFGLPTWHKQLYRNLNSTYD